MFCIAIPVSTNRDFFGMGYGQVTASWDLLQPLGEDETQETQPSPKEDPGLPLK